MPQGGDRMRVGNELLPIDAHHHTVGSDPEAVGGATVLHGDDDSLEGGLKGCVAAGPGVVEGTGAGVGPLEGVTATATATATATTISNTTTAATVVTATVATTD